MQWLELGIGWLSGAAFVLALVKLGIDPAFPTVGLNVALALWEFGHGQPVSALWLLGVALMVLFWNTGEGISNPYRGPTTLAGPIQPWQSVGVGPNRPFDLTTTFDWNSTILSGIRNSDPTAVHQVTGIWNPALVRPLLDDTEEDSHG